ncbi:MAG: ice-binding family protein [bacterium]|nr:ice-binding family protein [bacterium]
MRKNNKNSMVTALAIFLVLGLTGPITTLAAGPAGVVLGSAGNFVILTKSGISTTGSTSITGDIGVSPIAASAITGFGLIMDVSNTFSTSAQVIGKVYAADYTPPTPTTMTTAVSDMQTAYTDAAGRTNPTSTELGAGNIGGMTLAPGLYKWSTGVTIPTDVTLSGGANDVWIFQIAQNLTVSSATKVILTGGAQAANIFWQVVGQTTLGTTSVFNGTILDQTAIVLNTGARLNGRAFAQTAVTLDSSAVTKPTTIAPTPAPTSTSCVLTNGSVGNIPMGTSAIFSASGGNGIFSWSAPGASPSSGVGTTFTSLYNNWGAFTVTVTSASLSGSCNVNVVTIPPTQPTPPSTGGGQATPTSPTSSDTNIIALQTKLNGLLATVQSLQAQQVAQQSSFAPSLPNTGLPPEAEGNNIPWNTVIPTIISIALFSFYLVQKKWGI